MHSLTFFSVIFSVRYYTGSGYKQTLVEVIYKGFFFPTTQIWSLFSIGRCKNTWQLHLEKLWLSIPTKRINRPERLFTDFFIVLRDAFSQFKKFLLALFCSFLLITVIGKVTSLIEKTVVHLLELIDIPLSNLV